MTVVWIVLFILLFSLCALSWYLSGYSMRIRRQTIEQARQWQSEHYDISWYDKMEKRSHTVRSFDGESLYTEFLPCEKPTGQYVIISHGYTDNHIGSLKYARMYLALGFSVILYDLRGHGNNAPSFCTYTIRERRDLAAVIDDVRARHPDITLLGLHGESLGAATSIAVLDRKPPVDFVVADCGFSEIESVMAQGLVNFHVPAFFVHFASLASRLRYGYFYRDMRPIDSLRDNRIPILFIHGDKDDFIVPAHSEAMQKATKGYSELHLIPGAPHAASILTAPDKYRAYVTAFLKKATGWRQME